MDTEKDAICCPPFDPSLWDNKVFNWDKKPFIKDKVFTFLYMPLNFGKVMRRLNKRVMNAQAEIPDYLALSNHTSKWNMDIYLAVNRVIHGDMTATISGKFYSKVYEGDFKNTDKWCKDFEAFANVKGFKIKQLFMWYTTCPKCAKKYGKNYVAIIGQVQE